MSNLNKSEYSFVHLISNKLLKRIPKFVKKYYFLAESLIVEYRKQNIFGGVAQVNLSDKQSTSTMHHLLALKAPNFN